MDACSILSGVVGTGGFSPLLLEASSAGGGMGETVSRGIHLLCAMLAVGAIAYQRFALRPALDAHPSPELAEAARKRWAPFTHALITLLIATGIVQLMVAGMPKGEATKSYHMWFGIKFLAAMGVFFLVSVLGGRSNLAVRFREKGRLWGGVALLLAIVIVAISLHLRALPLPE